jgi:transposase
LPAQDAAVVARIEQRPDVARVAELARRITAIVRSRCGTRPTTAEAAIAELQRWLDEARSCGVRAVETFAIGLEQDVAAVHAALTTLWSSGQAEGQINKLKLLKRQTYGRALGGAAAARLAARLGMRTSRHTVLRELRQAGCLEPITAPVVIGIDDWAICREHKYGTIIVDLQRRCPIQLTDGRDTTAVGFGHFSVVAR